MNEVRNGVVTVAEANGVLPFVNNLWTTNLTGAQFKTLLEQQWQRDANNNIPTRAYLQLGLSENVSYTFDPALPEGSRITSITIDGAPYDPAASYKIATFSFLVTGGDNFRIFTQGTGAADTGLVDRDAWIDYIEENGTAPDPIAPDFQRRSVAVSPTPTTATVGSALQTTLSYLDFTSLGAPANTSVDVTLGGVSLGSLPVTFAAPGTAGPTNGASGTATLDAVVPATVPAGLQELEFVIQPSGKTLTFDVTVTAPDTTAPAAPVITSPTAGATVATGTPTISGTAEAASTVEVFDGPTSLGTTVTSGAGAWSLTPATALSEGAHSVTATATDGADNTSPASAAVAFTVTVPDTTAPAAPVITSPTAGAFLMTGTPTISGTAEAASTVEVFDGSTSLGTTVTSGAGAWALTPATALADGAHSVTATATDGAGNASPASAAVAFTVHTDGTPPPPPPPLTPGPPARILDTRTGGQTVDDLFEGIGIRDAGTTLVLDVVGRGGVPDDAIGVVLNLTATDATGPGYVTAWPCDATRPTASSVNFEPSAPSPNSVTSALAADGTICLFVAEAGVHLIADVNTSIGPDSPFRPINPGRLADSRDGAVTVDGLFLGGGARTPGSVWTIDVAGRAGVAPDAEVASLNVTITGGSGTGYVTVWSCSSPRPLASTVNFVAGQTVPNAVTSLLSAGGEVCIYVAEASADVIVDVNGFYADDSGYGALDPARLLDTRLGAPTTDGLFSGLGLVDPGEIVELDVAGRGGVPDGAVGAVLNITATDGTGTGYVTVWPCSDPPPNASTLNFVAGSPRANASVSALSDTGTVCLVVGEASAQLIVDVNGYL